MLIENRLTLALKKRKTALLLFAAAAVYFFAFAFLENPLKSTISDIGRTRLPLLALYCILLPLCDIVNVEYLLRSFKLKAPVLRVLFAVSNVCVGFVTTTLMPDPPGGEVKMFSVLLHWLTGFGNIVLNATVVLLLCLRLFKRSGNKKIRLLFVLGLCGCLSALFHFLAMTLAKGSVQEGKNGLYEIIPIVSTHIVLFVLNHTNLVSPKAERDKAESALSSSDNSVFTAVSLFFLGFGWLFFFFYSFVRNPIHYTISMTGLDYPLGFAVTCAFISVSLCLNFVLAFKRSGYKNPVGYFLAVVGSLSLMICVFWPTTESGTTLDPVHSVAAVLFFIFIMAAVFFFCLFKRKENKAYLPIGLGMFALLVLTLVIAFILNVLLEQRYGRTGLVEVIPLHYIFTFLFLENFTDVFKTEKKVSLSEKQKA